jgi:serine/threonine protein kinase
VPQLHLEFMAEGSIQDHIESHRHFSDRERRQIFAQTSDGLAYLHMLDPQIVHRDIKPANILVKYRRRDAIFVKFADFGLSREGDIFKTICGTCVYLAPEVYEAISLRPEAEEGYTTLVDVWSLGVVLAQLACGLPKSMGMRMAWNTSIGLAWCNKVRERVETMPRLEEDDLLMYVLRSMLCLRPEDRQSATDCRDQSALLLLNSTLENTDRMGGSQCSNNSGIEEPTIRVGNAQKFDSETIDSGNGDRL